MDELGFRPCRECGKRALIELAHGNGRICARCYVKRHRLDGFANNAARTLATSGASRPPPAASQKH